MVSSSELLEEMADLLKKKLEDPSDLAKVITEMERHPELSKFVFAVRHPLLFDSRFLGVLYVLMQFLLSAIFLVAGVLLVVPSTEVEFQSAIYQFMDLLTQANITGLRFLAFLVGLALLIMCVTSLSNAGEVLQGLGVMEES